MDILSLYLTYETPYNYSGSYAGQPKNASGSFAFSNVNQKFVTASLKMTTINGQ